MLTVLTIIAFIGIIYGVIAKIQNKVNEKLVGKVDRYGDPIEEGFVLPAGNIVLTISAIAFVLFFSVNTTLYRIGAQEVGVVVTPRGVADEELTTGWNFVAPWNSVKLMDKTVWVYTLTSNAKEGAKPTDDAIWAPTSDGIKMGFDISVNWRIDPKQASWIFANISADQDGEGKYHWIEENIIRPAIKSIMPLTISKYTPIECYSDKRSEIQAKVQAALKKELQSNHLVVEVAQIREVYYNPAYEASINQKKLEEQKVLTMVQITRQKDEALKQAMIDKDIAIQKAEGEAKALQIKGSSIASNPKIIQLEWIQKWNGALPTYMMGNGQGVIMNMSNKD
jgi:regulator of protease activity HflC (stomatin/prohibitin superfamily)